MTYNLGMQYVADLNNGGSLTTRVDYAYTDQFWRSLPFLRMDWYGPKNGGPIPAGYDESGDWGTVNARLVYQPPTEEWSLAVFGTNLTDEYMAEGRGAEWLESVPDALAAWARHNGCAAGVVAEDPAGLSSTMRYENCDDGAEVRMVRIDGLGHTWAREEVDATAVMWQFFRGHTLTQARQ